MLHVKVIAQRSHGFLRSDRKIKKKQGPPAVGQWAGAQGGPCKNHSNDKKNVRTLWWVSGRVDHSGPQKIRGPPLVGQRAGAEGGPRIVLLKRK